MKLKIRRLRAAVITRRYVVPAALLLLGVNVYCSRFVAGEHIPIRPESIERAIERKFAKTHDMIQGWLDAYGTREGYERLPRSNDSIGNATRTLVGGAGNDIPYIRRMWYANQPDRWHDEGIAVMLFKDTSMLYWSTYDYPERSADEWCEYKNTIEYVGRYQVLTRVYERGSHRAVAVLELFGSGAEKNYNPGVFRDQRINVFPSYETKRAQNTHAVKISAGEDSFYVEALPRGNMPLAAELCGWLGAVLLMIALRDWLLRRTRCRNLSTNVVLGLVMLSALRVGFYLAGIPNQNGPLFEPIYGQHNSIIGSLGDVLLTALTALVYSAFIYKVRRKATKRCSTSTKLKKGVFILWLYLFIGVIAAGFHYIFILSIYTPKINLQIYDVFSVTYMTFIFYIVTGVYFAARILLNQFTMQLFGSGWRSTLWQALLSSAIILLLLGPVEHEINGSGYLMALFQFAYMMLNPLRRRMSNYTSFLLSMAVFASYITLFSLRETAIAQNNAQKIYAMTLATSPYEGTGSDKEQQLAEELASNARFRYLTHMRIANNKASMRYNNSNDYQYIASRIVPGRDTTLSYGQQNHFVYNFYTSPDRLSIIIVTRPEATFLDAISLFVYNFIIVLIISGLILRLCGYLFNTRFFSGGFTIRIRTAVLGVVLITMGAVTFVIVRNTVKNLRTERQRFMNNSIQQISDQLTQVMAGTADSTSQAREKLLHEWFARQNRYSNVVICIYTTGGHMKYCSHESPSHSHNAHSIISNGAYRSLHYMGQPIYNEELTEEHRLAAYVPIYSGGRAVCYMALSYYTFDTGHDLVGHGLLADILNLFLVILFLSVILAEVLCRVLIKPFRQMREAMININSMQKIDAGSGQRISDEVGMLVCQYNTMIDDLEESYRRLARSERESAWREMAKQVAHEIKNPLTPMRLKIQMLQRSTANAVGKTVSEKGLAETHKTLDLLLEQIDLLNRIASEFSDFAKIGEGKPARLDLLPLLCNILRLYSEYDNITVSLSTYDHDCHSLPADFHFWVRADGEHLTRVFVNILKNAVEALDDAPNGAIEMTVRADGERVHVDIADNGPGIPGEMQKKIFQPNFTTKSGGSGLGLALSLKIMELIGGNISFKSSAEKGTVFTVTLPLLPDPDSAPKTPPHEEPLCPLPPR